MKLSLPSLKRKKKTAAVPAAAPEVPKAAPAKAASKTKETKPWVPRGKKLGEAAAYRRRHLFGEVIVCMGDAKSMEAVFGKEAGVWRTLRRDEVTVQSYIDRPWYRLSIGLFTKRRRDRYEKQGFTSPPPLNSPPAAQVKKPKDKVEKAQVKAPATAA